jgi:endonuclease/exonuclease/phosphatase family metal-dependent hydrolase
MSTDALILSDEGFSGDSLSSAALLLASYLTDPACKVHEFYRRIQVIDALHPLASPVENCVRKVFLALGMGVSASIAVFTTVPGIALRFLVVNLREDPFSYQKRDGSKTLPRDGSFSLLSWNICGIGAGFAISDGGLLPWQFRIERIINQIIEKDADVNCLYEVFDPQAAEEIAARLKERGYTHFYYNIGTLSMGVSSGIFVASKYAIEKPEFTPFPQEALVGRAQFTAKGVFGFDLKSQGRCFARIFATHLQHSEEPGFPEDKEVEARKKEMGIILGKIEEVRDKCIVVTGDLNLDDKEYRGAEWQSRFQKGDRFTSSTWKGDDFCAKLMEKRASGACNLDHTMLLSSSAGDISTELVETGYDPKSYREEALSDHEGLLSVISPMRIFSSASAAFG